MGVLLLEPRPLRAVADDHLAAGPGHLEECIDVLFDRDTADVGRDRARQGEGILRIRLEHLGIDAPAPGRPGLETMRPQNPARPGRGPPATRRPAAGPHDRPGWNSIR